MCEGRAQSRRRCGRGEPSPAADVAGVSPVPAQMLAGRAQSRRKCERGEPSPVADVGGGEPSPAADVAGVSPVPEQMWAGRTPRLRAAPACSRSSHFRYSQGLHKRCTVYASCQLHVACCMLHVPSLHRANRCTACSRVPSRCRGGSGGGSSPCAEVAAAGPVQVQMWQRQAQSRCRCGDGGSSPGADVATSSSRKKSRVHREEGGRGGWSYRVTA